MSDAVSFVEIDGQHVELLPARTVMSVFSLGKGGGDGGTGGNGGTAQGGVGVNVLSGIGVLGTGCGQRWRRRRRQRWRRLRRPWLSQRLS